jgi:hypothetical protein
MEMTSDCDSTKTSFCYALWEEWSRPPVVSLYQLLVTQRRHRIHGDRSSRGAGAGNRGYQAK